MCGDGVHVAKFRGLAVGDLADDAGVETGKLVVVDAFPPKIRLAKMIFKVLVGIYHADRSFDFHTGEKIGKRTSISQVYSKREVYSGDVRARIREHGRAEYEGEEVHVRRVLSHRVRKEFREKRRTRSFETV